jgi:putative Mn2+ efflux pump MntP
MGLIELFLIAVGLSMDAFAVSLCKGLYMKKLNLRSAGIIALFFGGFQAAMPLLGWLLGRQFERYITSVDHWITFGLLAFIGGKMIYEVFQEDCGDEEEKSSLKIRELLMLAVATSIDALAVGISFAFLKVEILPGTLHSQLP